MVDILVKHKLLSRNQIADFLGWDKIRVSHILKPLIKCGEVRCVELDRFQSADYLELKGPTRRMRFYYVSKKYMGEE